MTKALIITGATGQQGGALIDALVAADADFEIIGVSRDPASKSAQKLAKKSPKIKVISGNLDKPDEIFANAKKVTSLPIHGVYSVQVAIGFNPFDDSELRQGKALVDSALANNVSHFVYSSVDRGGDASYDNATSVPHFVSKHEIEHHLVERSRGTQMSYTILRPVAFMNNLQPGMAGAGFSTIWDVMLGQQKPLQLVATSDIGYFGAQAFMQPQEYKNKGISLAGDELNFEQFKKVYKRTTGEELAMTYRVVAWLFILLSRDMRLMFKWFWSHGYNVDIPALRKAHPGLKTFGQWLEMESPFLSKRS